MSFRTHQIARVFVLAGSVTLALSLGASAALSATLATTCSIAVKDLNIGSTTIRDGVATNDCVDFGVPNATSVAAGRRGVDAEFSVYEKSSCSGALLSHAIGYTDLIPPIRFPSVRMNNCPS
jgi:hypothetical protein